MGKKKDKSRDRSDSESSSSSSASSRSSVSKKYGKPHEYDPTFEGPIKNRSCTDIPCCILFLVFIAGMGVIAYFSFINGNPDTIIYPSDYKGNVCNRSQEVLGKPYSFYFDYLDCLDASAVLTLRCPSVQVCLAECPSETYSIYTRYAPFLYFPPSSIPPAAINWDDFICLYDIDPEYEVMVNERQIYDLLLVEDCAGYYVESVPIGDRCLPAIFDIGEPIDGTPNGRNVTEENISALEQLVDLILSSEQVANLVEDFQRTWPFLLIGMGIAMTTSFLFLILLQWLATFIVWGIIILLLGTLSFGTYYTYDQWQCFEIPRNECKPLDISNPEFRYFEIDSYARIPDVWLGFFITLCVIGGIIFLLVLILFTRIRIATALLEEASQAVGMMLCSLFWPIVPFILHLIFISFWALVAVFLASSGQATYIIINAPQGSDIVNGSSCDMAEWKANESYPALCVFQDFKLPDYTIYLQVYMVLALFWVVNFIIALGEMTLAGAYASYYWAYEKPKDIPTVPLLASFWRSIRYHLGSLAFGSLIIAIIQLIRVLLDYVEKKVHAKKNPVTRFIFCCCKCIFWCLEKFMRFINRNAYIEIAIYGYNFCTAAKKAFFLLMRNILRVAVLNGITSFILFLFKFTIALGMSIGAFYFFSWSSTGSGNEFFGLADINYIWAPVLVIGLASYVVSAAFFSVYDMGVDTLFLCFLEDLERNDGSADKPYYMPRSLMQILGKKNKKDKDKKKKNKDKKKKKKKKSGKVEAEDSF